MLDSYYYGIYFRYEAPKHKQIIICGSVSAQVSLMEVTSLHSIVSIYYF